MDATIKDFNPVHIPTKEAQGESKDTFKPEVNFQAVQAAMNSMPSVEAWSQGEGV